VDATDALAGGPREIAHYTELHKDHVARRAEAFVLAQAKRD
jgi:hypothetical protein